MVFICLQLLAKTLQPSQSFMTQRGETDTSTRFLRKCPRKEKRTLGLNCKNMLINMNCQRQDEMREQALMSNDILPFFVVVSPCFSNIHRGTQVVLISTTHWTNGDCYMVDYLQITNFTKSLASSQFLILWKSLSLGTFWPLYPESNGLGYARGF